MKFLIDVWKIFILVFVCFLTAGCEEDEMFYDKMKLSDEQITRVKPIIKLYIKKQNKIIKEIKDNKPPENFSGSDGERPEMSGPPPMQFPGNKRGGLIQSEGPYEPEMPPMMENMSGPFEENDNAAIKTMEPYVTDDQIARFKKIAADFRRVKLKEIFGSNGKPGKGGRPGGPGGF